MSPLNLLPWDLSSFRWNRWELVSSNPKPKPKTPAPNLSAAEALLSGSTLVEVVGLTATVGGWAGGRWHLAGSEIRRFGPYVWLWLAACRNWRHRRSGPIWLLNTCHICQHGPKGRWQLLPHLGLRLPKAHGKGWARGGPERQKKAYSPSEKAEARKKKGAEGAKGSQLRLHRINSPWLYIG